jgi:hypothetical protein
LARRPLKRGAGLGRGRRRGYENAGRLPMIARVLITDATAAMVEKLKVQRSA